MPLSPSYRGFVYLIGNRHHCWYKIGKANSPQIRIRDVGILLPFKLEKFALWKVEKPLECERHMHDLYATYRLNGEWFSFSSVVVEKIIDTEPPFVAERMFPSVVQRPFLFPKQRNHSRESIEERYQKRLVRKAFGAAIMEYVHSHDLESTPQNRRFAAEIVYNSDPKAWKLMPGWSPSNAPK